MKRRRKRRRRGISRWSRIAGKVGRIRVDSGGRRTQKMRGSRYEGEG